MSLSLSLVVVVVVIVIELYGIMMRILLFIIVLIVLYDSISSAILRIGKPLRWESSLSYLNDVRYSGIKQFINHYKRSKDIITSSFKWGDELEYGIFKYDKRLLRYDLALRGTEIREELEELEKTYEDLGSGCIWQPEYGAWMVISLSLLLFSLSSLSLSSLSSSSSG